MENDDINIFGKELNQKDIEEENDLDISNNKGLIIFSSPLFILSYFERELK